MGRSESVDQYTRRDSRAGLRDGARLARTRIVLVQQCLETRIVAQGLPEEFIDLANQRMAAINAAYERVAKQRGLA